MLKRNRPLHIAFTTLCKTKHSAKRNTLQNETRRPKGRRVYETSVVSDGTNVLCLITLRATSDLEFDGLAFFE